MRMVEFGIYQNLFDGEDQAQNLKKYVGDSCLELGRNADGSLIGIVARRATTANSNIFIRKDWLDDLGLEVPTTTDELKKTFYMKWFIIILMVIQAWLALLFHQW